MGMRRVLAEHTTLRVGGPADDWWVAESEDALIDMVGRCDAEDRPVLVLGGGSNVLVADDGFPGTVVEVATTGVDARETDAGTVLLRIAAGEVWDDVVSRAVARGWSGIEALSGIPGRVGATPVQNVGAYGQEVAQVVRSVRVLDRRTSEVVDLAVDDCAFGYRTSMFKRDPDRWVILAVTLELRTDGRSSVTYADLASTLGIAEGEQADVSAVRGAVLALRARKGMVLREDDHDTWSAGSFFTNPVISASEATALPPECPRYPSADGVKVSAAWLIERSGVPRGYSLPGSRAAISGRHTLALTNRGGATAQEIVDLATHVCDRVWETFGIRLTVEPVLVGVNL
jgi:UDP-N-acetylmuramate dehydrogenase